MWYKFKNGKQKIDQDKKNTTIFWKKNPEAKKRLEYLFELNFKELYRGETTEQEIVEDVQKEFNIIIKKEYLKYL